MPRKRAKARLTRMDAACDHLERMGFARAEVRRTVNYLLKEVYLGADAWPFLEEDSYRVVFEAILERQAAEGGGPPELEDEELTEEANPLGIAGCAEQGGSPHSPLDAVSASDICSAANVSAGDVEEEGREGCTLIANVNSMRRRPPTYGWISEDEDEDEDEIVAALLPTTCKEEVMVQVSFCCHRDRKRKSRWDVKPEDKGGT